MTNITFLIQVSQLLTIWLGKLYIILILNTLSIVLVLDTNEIWDFQPFLAIKE